MSEDKNLAGENIRTDLSSCNFNGKTSRKFDEHITKSFPGYDVGQLLIASYSDSFINLTSKRIYDLGCSTGTLLKIIESRHSKKDISYIRIDKVPEMLEIARNQNFIEKSRFKFECKDILDFNF